MSKKAHLDALDVSAQAERDLAAAADERQALEEALSNARAQVTSMRQFAERLEQQNASQEMQLAEMSDLLASLSSKTSREREMKEALEALLQVVQEDSAAAHTEAQAARRRAEELAKEQARIEAERTQLAAEKSRLEARTAEYDALVNELNREIEAGQVTITELSGKLTVNVSNAILFDSGQTLLKPDGKQALIRVAGVLDEVQDREIRVEGHTDNVPVSATAPYPDNWALSSLRASNVVSLLVESGVDPLNVASVGYGEHRPTASNDTSASRALNRRIEIVLVPRLRARK